jgi:hypothetical protein
MGEPIVIDSTLGGGSMATAYSADMRLRVIGRVQSGSSRREAAEHYEVSPSTAVIWVKCFRETGRCAAKPRGGSTSPLEKHADFLLALSAIIAKIGQPMGERSIAGKRVYYWCTPPQLSSKSDRGPQCQIQATMSGDVVERLAYEGDEALCLKYAARLRS